MSPACAQERDTLLSKSSLGRLRPVGRGQCSVQKLGWVSLQPLPCLATSCMAGSLSFLRSQLKDPLCREALPDLPLSNQPPPPPDQPSTLSPSAWCPLVPLPFLSPSPFLSLSFCLLLSSTIVCSLSVCLASVWLHQSRAGPGPFPCGLALSGQAGACRESEITKILHEVYSFLLGFEEYFLLVLATS